MDLGWSTPITCSSERFRSECTGFGLFGLFGLLYLASSRGCKPTTTVVLLKHFITVGFSFKLGIENWRLSYSRFICTFE